MYCPRLDHFARINSNGTISRCGHMVNPPGFTTLDEMDNSDWLKQIKKSFADEIWPKECVRCQEIENQNLASIRTHALELDKKEHNRNYLQIGGVLDNICNAACITCNSGCSTRIGALTSKSFPIINNSEIYWSFPQERIRHLDINGGEPSYSKNYKKILNNLPPNLSTLRVNTNCNIVLEELTEIAQKGIEVTVTVSCDGIGPVHELMRWPITWDTFYKNLMRYKTMPVKLNLWTTVTSLNVDDLPNIQSFANEHNIDYNYAYLKHPSELSVDNKNTTFALTYIEKQKQLRGIV
jgi:MoaA/NifB/PqqE/SkfB family radical SAM enzyme